jgi:hypothetical protein
MGLGPVVMAHDRDARRRGAGHHMGAHLRPAGARAVQQVLHHVATGCLVDLHLVDHVIEPAVDIRALPVAGRVVHDRDEPGQRMARRGIEKRHGGRVRHLAAQVQEVLGTENALALPVVQRGDEGLEDLPAFGPLHRGADRKAVEDRCRSGRDDHGVMGHERGQVGPGDGGARMGVAFHVIGVDIDDAGNEERPAEVETDAPARRRDRRDPAFGHLEPAIRHAPGRHDPGVFQGEMALRRLVEHEVSFPSLPPCACGCNA